MPQQQTSSPGQGQRFDWWAAPAAATDADRSTAPGRSAVPAQPVPTRTVQQAPVQAAQPVAVERPPVRAAAAPLAEPAVEPAAARALVPATDSTEVYRAVQRSEAFQDIRRSYRAFVFPTSGAFLGWYLLYVAAQAAAPGLMRSQVAGPLNVAWLLGLLQFATTFLLTWLYARNARTKRDRAALGLRWDTQDQLR
ncbi:uncharacterized membrane protein (DUF485 family) [Kitasatospora sp. MAA19]|uniref:DUF485 domain-containing protein n=1 Tax=Kitasatospora sp. MAA19 TaxID=3035090 RepID=UPI0024771E05|nr:DUF485 domain-containing protein [Kitasatospora sp. MAA19]MDH6709958.1 uncharacterized membrane protein (DUF485 family) [Kitasatospora sp. MAA19]